MSKHGGWWQAGWHKSQVGYPVDNKGVEKEACLYGPILLLCVPKNETSTMGFN